MTDETLTEGVDTTVAGEETPTEETTTQEKPEIPEGFDDKLYDTETKSLRIDAVKERFDNDKKEMESLKKQRDDMRRKLSKGANVPDKIEDYEFIPEERYNKYMGEGDIVGDHIRQCFDKLSDIAFKNGVSKEADAIYKQALLDELEALRVVDTRSQEQIDADKAKELEKQKEILGADYKEIVEKNVDFYKASGPFTTEERKFMMDLMSKSGHANNIFRKVREMLDTGRSMDIPTTATDAGSASKLAAEYNDPNTSDRRRTQILEQAAKEGWKVGDFL